MTQRIEDMAKKLEVREWWLRTFVLLCSFHFSLIASWAQSLTAHAPSHVAVGEQFRLSYTVNTQSVSGFRAGNIPDAFEVLMGPSTSTQSSFQMVNGHTSQSSSVTYTYILVATKNGTFTIPPASVTANGNAIQSSSLKITVSGQSQSGANGGNGGGGRQQQGNSPHIQEAGSAISGSDLFIRVNANKKRVHEQEPILLTYKVYTVVGLTELRGNMPDLKSFYTQEIPLPQQKEFKIETVNGRPYKTVTWSQYIMYPQMTGKLQIPSITFNGVVVQQNRNVDPFEAFFNGGSNYIEVKKQIQAPGIEIQVDPLPEHPAQFSGGVGHFNVSAKLDKTEVKANDPITLQVTVSGTGNLKLIKEPVVKFPNDFDRYDAKVTNKTKLTTRGLEGSVVYDFLAVPRHQGKYEIPAVEFTYYDTEANTYKTLKTEAFTLDVAKGASGGGSDSYTSQEDLKLLNKDIRYIKTGNSTQHVVGDTFFGSSAYWISLALLVLVFVSLFIVFRQRAIDNADIVQKRAGKANKVASKRLKKAAKLMNENKPGEFYDEVLHALWGYVGDKLSIPIAQLSHDNIAERFMERNVQQETIDLFTGAIDECEFERYAPGDPKGNMNKVYETAMNAIERIEGAMKKGGKGKVAAPKLILLWMLLLPSMTVSASSVTKEIADSAYAQGHYQKAIKDYTELLQQGASADIYYNLGNAYYRVEDMTHAILSYERALLLSPGDADIRFNLQMARSKTVDKITPESEMFFVTWYHSLVNLMSVDGWARTALFSLALAIVLALVYLFVEPVWLRKVGFFGAIFLIAVFVMSNWLAYQQQQNLINRKGAIVTEAAVTVRSTPAADGTDLFILHEGTKVTITDATMKDWKKIRLADGKQGWIETTQIEII